MKPEVKCEAVSPSMPNGHAPLESKSGGLSDGAGKAAIVEKLQLHSVFLRVTDLARMMAISANSVRCQIRQGRFPIPHRRIGKVVVVKTDDFIDWYRGPGASESAQTNLEGVQVKAQSQAREEVEAPIASFDSPAVRTIHAETEKERGERIKQEVLASMRRRKFK